VLEELEKRLPANVTVFRQMSFFAPRKILSATPPKFSEMPFLECILDCEDLSDLEQQWRQVSQVMPTPVVNTVDLMAYFLLLDFLHIFPS